MIFPRTTSGRLGRAALLLLVPLPALVLNGCGGTSGSGAPAGPPPAPVITGISPNYGSAGTKVTITGDNFNDMAGLVGTSGVLFGNAQAQNANRFFTILATVPPGRGTVDVTAFDSGGGSPIVPADRFTYTNNAYAYVVNQSANTITEYSYNAAGGALTAAGTPTTTGSNPIGMTLRPNTNNAYVINQGSRTISEYAVDSASGALTDLTGVGTLSLSDPNPVDIAISPNGNFAYVTDQSTDTITLYAVVVSNGALTATGTTFPAGTAPAGITFSPDGSHAYVVSQYGAAVTSGPPSQSGATITEYTANAATGALSAPTPMTTGDNPTGIAFTPDGRFAYVTNNANNTVGEYSVNTSTGALTSLGATPTGTAPAGVAVSIEGRFAYVTNNGNGTVSEYSINTSTGALTSTGTLQAGSSPNGIVFTP